ncbi:outer membrane lipoprotein LolB [Massilia niabensis]|uniref:Outer-membrane lipoprotein LolB n=1 Tax=Massilia niabensis TaxID=544910 RepID=A0ABW0L3X9_9BURK
MPLTRPLTCRIARRLSLFAIAAVLAGCATTSNQPGTSADASVGAYRDTIDLGGRLSVNYQKDGQPGSVTGNFEWSQQPGRIDVTLVSPTGQTVATINVTPQQATLTQANQAPRSAKDIDTLTSQALGWSLPVSGLRDWLQGYATGTDGKRFAASPAKNEVFTADGWRLRFVSWNQKAAAPTPSVIHAERSATATTEELSIRIAINSAS